MGLTLSRKQGESFEIGNATVRVNKIKGGTVSISIEAPKEVLIRRTELKGKDERK
jgi:carbon storage regulator CsrA